MRLVCKAAVVEFQAWGVTREWQVMGTDVACSNWFVLVGRPFVGFEERARTRQQLEAFYVRGEIPRSVQR